jgi:hypothetical protein
MDSTLPLLSGKSASDPAEHAHNEPNKQPSKQNAPSSDGDTNPKSVKLNGLPLCKVLGSLIYTRVKRVFRECRSFLRRLSVLQLGIGLNASRSGRHLWPRGFAQTKIAGGRRAHLPFGFAPHVPQPTHWACVDANEGLFGPGDGAMK